MALVFSGRSNNVNGRWRACYEDWHDRVRWCAENPPEDGGIEPYRYVPIDLRPDSSDLHHIQMRQEMRTGLVVTLANSLDANMWSYMIGAFKRLYNLNGSQVRCARSPRFHASRPCLCFDLVFFFELFETRERT